MTRNRQSARCLVASIALAAYTTVAVSPALAGAASPSAPASGAGSASAAACQAMTGDIDVVFAESVAEDRAFMGDLVTRFEAANPGIKVNLEIVPWNDIYGKVQTLIATNQAPDVLTTNQYATYAADGLLNPVEDVLSAEAIAGFDPNLLSSGQVDGVQYGIPWVASVSLLGYNKDLFAEAGITKVPTTWDELRDAALKIKATGNIGYAIRGNPSGADEAMSMALFGAGGAWKDGDTYTIDTPEGLEALTFLSDLAQKDQVVNVNPASAGGGDTRELFSQGKIGMMVGASFWPEVIGALNPDLNFGLAPYPGKSETVSFALVSYLMSFKTANDPRLGGCFLEFYFANENLIPHEKMLGGLPPTTAAQQAMAATDPQLAEFIALLNTAKFEPNADPAWGPVLTAIGEKFGLVIEGRAPAKGTLEEWQALAEQTE